MPTTHAHHQQILRRAHRSRAKLAENKQHPRLSVHRTLRALYVQIIDDATGKTLASAHSREAEVSGKTKTERAESVGTLIAKRALEKKVKAVRFDRGAFKYHGRVAAVASAARKAGLTF